MSMVQEIKTNVGGLSEALLSRYSGPCPRYTSYPTADRFSALDGVRPWAALQDIRSLSLYVHIPFCRSLCYFCACNKVITQQYGLASSYLDHLLQEVRWYRDKVARVPVTQLHLGGGTPTFLNDADLRRLMEGLGEVFELNPGDGVEYSIEADPRTLEPETLDTLRELGFNRLSLGIQDFDAKVQQSINRICSADQVSALTAAAREQGFASISYDLIYGLPQQNLNTLQRTLDRVLALQPDRIALYHYAHLPHRFKAQRLIDTDLIPPAAEKIAIQLAAVEHLARAGYAFLGMDHFARSGDELAKAADTGRLQRNFQGYTLMPADALVGLGASAISYSRSGFWQNLHRLKEYARAIGERGNAACRGWWLSEEDRLRQRVISELMCRLRLDKGEIERCMGTPFAEYFHTELERLQPMFDDGLIYQDDKAIVVTEQGRWFVRNVASAFDSYLHNQPTQAKYSRVL
ncbi:oxygen-independent coproporphyrinogen III oxidase [Microbulbifer sp. 2205BS26-8]|uniref:oxygen-independent coproporphyrinogen III oxidase n=1 Tax=Microbulbifer sp. 2205BS26-8 TaxID=3064386 RepID=UPI00273DED29|nr:oxygen-independent coproporphyrinogen III oxidase [Microbulbifer sp. 2205BS26-8]MDP5208617.1 oxygen-independent coproporphyrinogen III oxidase [Microbulbifer sp. 2205BS26-8]